jgi:hypothetical protein
MGFAMLPYSSIRMALLAEEVCRGNWHIAGIGLDGKELNLFQWKRIRLNFLGSREYDPCTLWITKVHADGRVACNIFSFVDDERVTRLDEELTWQASHVLASKQSYLGIQDAGQKACPCSKQPGAWAARLFMFYPLSECMFSLQQRSVQS